MFPSFICFMLITFWDLYLLFQKHYRFIHSIKDSGPGHELCRIIKEENISLAIIGSRSTAAKREKPLGTTATYLLRNSSVPLSICRKSEFI